MSFLLLEFAQEFALLNPVIEGAYKFASQEPSGAFLRSLLPLDPHNKFKLYSDPLERFSGVRLRSFLNKYPKIKEGGS